MTLLPPVLNPPSEPTYLTKSTHNFGLMLEPEAGADSTNEVLSLERTTSTMSISIRAVLSFRFMFTKKHQLPKTKYTLFILG